jgi:hypothetical protein
VVTELDEMVAPGGNAWLDQHVPLLADFECGACGQIGRHQPGCPNHYSEEVLMDTATPCKIEGCNGEAVQRMGKYGGLCEAHRPTRANGNGAVSLPEQVVAVGQAADLSDRQALDVLAKYLRDHDDWNGGDFCELANDVITRTGRSLTHRFQAVVVVVRVEGDELDGWDTVADALHPIGEVQFIGQPWRVTPAGDEFDTSELLQQYEK